MAKTVQISAEFVGLQQSLEKQVAAVAKGQGGLKIPINDRAFNTSLRGMTANVRSFEQSLDLSNRRVIAFGTSASIVYGMVRGFKELLGATIEVEKRMTSINSIFGLSSRNLDSFSKSLFNVARQTGQSFDEVATAAEEFSRQGLGVEETLKRTRDTMILVRLTGLDTAKAVSTLTAAVSTFGRAGEDTNSILNKIVAADQKFAVSARDIAEAFQRVGSVVDDAGVPIERFIGLVTAAKQITSRDGAVIGNSLKTIFTRLERSSTLDDLEALGVAVRNTAGEALPAMQVFESVAKSYGNLGREQKNLVAQLGAGVFQINQFKALLLDLGRGANGVAAQAENAAANATNEALIRNATLNDTLATSIQNLQTSAKEAASVVGSLVLKPAINTAIDMGSLIAKPFQNLSATGGTGPGENFGKYIGESILKGIGNVLAGPGLIFIAKAVGGVLGKAAPEIGADVKAAGGIFDARVARGSSVVSSIRAGLAPTGEAEALQRTNALLSAATKEELARFAAAKAVAEQEAIILAILERQAVVSGAAAAPAIRSLRGSRRTPFGASGYVPMGEEAAAIAAGVGGAPANARPVYLSTFNRGGGQTGIVANTSEFKVPGAAGGAIFNRDMIRRYGLPPGSTPVAAGGFIPNAAEGGFSRGDIRASGGQFASQSTIDSLNKLFAAVSSAETGRQARELGKGVIDIAEGLSKASKQGVLTQLGAVLHEFNTGRVVRAGVGPGVVEADRPAPTAPYDFPANASGQSRAARKFSAAIETDTARETFLRASDAKQRDIGFNRAVARVQSGTDITPHQQLLVKEVYRDQARTVAAKVFAPGASDKAIKAFVSEYADAQIEKLNVAGTAALLAKDTHGAVKKEALSDAERARRAERFAGTANRVQNGLLIGSIASGFIPEGRGGTAAGQGFGALSSGLQGGALGGSLGSLFGPLGTLIGAGVGGLGGAIKGFIDRTSKSFEELAEEIGKENEKLKGQVEAVSQAFNLQGRIAEGGLGKGGLGRTRRELSSTLARVTDPELRRLILSGSAEDQQKATELLADRQQKASIQQAVQLTFKKAIVGGDRSDESLTATAGALQSSYANLSNADLAQRAAEARNPTGEAAAAIKLAGGSSFAGRAGAFLQHPLLANSPFGSLGAILSKNAEDSAGEFATDAKIKAITAEQQRRADEAIQEAAIARDTNRITRADSFSLARRLGVQGQLAGVRASGASQITQGLQQIRLEAPGLTDFGRLALQGQFGRENIATQFGTARDTALSGGKKGLIDLLRNAGVTDRGLIERVAGATGKGDLVDLQGGLTSVFANKAPAETLKQAQTAITDLVDSLTVLNASEQEAIKVNDQLNDAAKRKLQTDRTVPAVRANLRESLSLSRQLQTLQDQATVDLAGNPETSDLISGDALSGAKLGQAGRAGAKGKSSESFARGFGAIFAGAAQDARNFAEVGQQVATSLRDSFAGAFGDFVTGAKKAKDAFRDFIVSVLADAARAFATKAVTSLLGMLLGNIGGGYNKGSVTIPSGQDLPGGSANGGYISRAAGGLIPTMLMGGEMVYPPAQAARIGGRMLKALNTGTARGFAPGGLVMGGSGVKDDVFQPLAAGSFVVRKAMVERYGAGNLATLSMGGSPDGAMASMMATPTAAGVVSGGGGGVFNIGVNITDNSTTSQSSSSQQPGGGLADRQLGDTLARRIKATVLQTIEEQTRSGGILRIQGLRAST